jgi:hypothetical protein
MKTTKKLAGGKLQQREQQKRTAVVEGAGRGKEKGDGG